MYTATAESGSEAAKLTDDRILIIALTMITFALTLTVSCFHISEMYMQLHTLYNTHACVDTHLYLFYTDFSPFQIHNHNSYS